MKIHPWLDSVRPDEIAECWEGVPGDLYKALWDCVPHYTKINYEDCGPHDVIGINGIDEFWNRFTPEHQAKLNELAEAHKKYIRDLQGKVD